MAAEGQAWSDTETPRFVRGFHDVLITIGVAVALGGLWGLAALYAVLPAIIVLSEILVRRQRLALLTVSLTIALFCWTVLLMSFYFKPGTAFFNDIGADMTQFVAYASRSFSASIMPAIACRWRWRSASCRPLPSSSPCFCGSCNGRAGILRFSVIIPWCWRWSSSFARWACSRRRSISTLAIGCAGRHAPISPSGFIWVLRLSAALQRKAADFVRRQLAGCCPVGVDQDACHCYQRGRVDADRPCHRPPCLRHVRPAVTRFCDLWHFPAGECDC